MRTIAFAVALFLCSLAAHAQTAVTVEDVPPNIGTQNVNAYSGSNLIYRCWAKSVVPARVSRVTTITSATNASPVVFTVSGGHGFDTNSRPLITLAGGTGNWLAVNGSRVATILSSTTYSVAVDSTSLGAVAGTVTYTTTAPRTTAAEWAVLRYSYDGSGNLIAAAWDNGTPSAMNSACAASTTSNLQ
jgi:hypothetical protein